MRFLRICLDAPYPPNAGGRLDPYHSILQLSKRGHATTVLTYLVGERDLSPLRDICDLHVIQFRGKNSLLNMARGVIERYPVNYVKYRNQEMLCKCLELLNSRSFDVVIVEQSALGWFVFEIRKRHRIPVVSRWHNLDTLIWERWIESQSNPAKRFLGWRQHAFVKRLEYKLAMASDLCLTIGALDTELLRRLAPKANVRFMPAGVDLDHYKPTTEGREPWSVMFLASSYDWHPNWDAAHWLYHEIMPRIWQQIPDARLYFTGTMEPQMKEWAASGRAVFTGYVPDERAAIAKASVLVIPMRLGGGMKLKLPTAFACGKAVVSTSAGAEGIPGLAEGEDLLIRDTAEEFANATVQVLRDDNLREKLENNGRAFVVAGYGCEVIGEQWEEALFSVTRLTPRVAAVGPLPSAEGYGL